MPCQGAHPTRHVFQVRDLGRTWYPDRKDAGWFFLHWKLRQIKWGFPARHGGTPIAGWFISLYKEKRPIKIWMMFGAPHILGHLLIRTHLKIEIVHTDVLMMHFEQIHQLHMAISFFQTDPLMEDQEP